MGLAEFFSKFKKAKPEEIAKQQILEETSQTLVMDDVAWFKRLMSHNVRMPLAIISGYTELLLSDTLENEEQKKECLKNISKNLDFIDALTKVILDDDKEYLLKDKEELDILEIIRAASEYVKNVAMKSGVRVLVNSTEEAIVVKGNKFALIRAFFNMIENSLRYMNKEGDIVFTVQEQEGEVLIVYRDNGEGMPAGEVGNITKLNYRGETQNTQGSGLGMYLVEQTILEHGGKLEARSDIGKGMAIYITIPTNL